MRNKTKIFVRAQKIEPGRYWVLTLQPVSEQMQVAPCPQLIVQPPPSQAPIVHVSPGAHSMEQ